MISIALYAHTYAEWKTVLNQTYDGRMQLFICFIPYFVEAIKDLITWVATPISIHPLYLDALQALNLSIDPATEGVFFRLNLGGNECISH